MGGGCGGRQDIRAIGAAAVGARMTPAECMWKSNPRKSPLSAPATSNADGLGVARPREGPK